MFTLAALVKIVLAGKCLIVLIQKEREGTWIHDEKVVGGTVLLSQGQPCNFVVRFTDTERTDQTAQLKPRSCIRSAQSCSEKNRHLNGMTLCEQVLKDQR